MSLVKQTKNEAGEVVYRARRAGEKSDTKPVAKTASRTVSKPAEKPDEAATKTGA